MDRAGFTTMAACEVEAWRRALYAENNPHVRLYDDVRTLTANRLLADLGRLPTIVVGSPPCQDISSANTKGKGVEGERSGLYFEAIRIIGEVRPRWFALENSHNLRTRGADAVLAALEALDYTCWPLVVRAGDVGANHERPRCWLIGCDLAQVDDPTRFPSHAITGLRGGSNSLTTGGDARYTPGERQRAWTGSQVGEGRADEWHELADVLDDPDLGRIGPGHVCKHGIMWPHACVPCDEAAYAARTGHAGWSEIRSGWQARDEHAGNDACAGARTVGGENATDADQAGQADGCLVTGLRSAEVADDGCCPRRGADEQGAGQMGVCSSDCEIAHRSGADWSLAHLADHLRMDDGLSAWLASQRVALSDGKGQSAASLIVEAFGDAVIPQIPEAIGRAILRVERALGALLRPDDIEGATCARS